MKRRIYPKAFHMFVIFPLVSVAFVGTIYILFGGIVTGFDLLPLQWELSIEYNVILFTIPCGFFTGILYWNSRRIVIRNDELVIRTEISKIKRTRIKINDITEICSHKFESDDTTLKFHIHTTYEYVKVIEFWYDEEKLKLLAEEIKVINPNIIINHELDNTTT